VVLLVAGLVLFIGIHSVRLVAPDFREGVIASRGDGAWKGIYSVASIVGFVLLIYGYGIAREDAEILYQPIDGARGVSYFVMPISFVLLIASQMPAGYIKKATAHPMLWGVVFWAIVHLANNGDSASVVLFVSLLVWAVLDLVSCYRRVGTSSKASVVADAVAVIGGLIGTYAFIRFFHDYLFGVPVI